MKPCCLGSEMLAGPVEYQLRASHSSLARLISLRLVGLYTGALMSVALLLLECVQRF